MSFPKISRMSGSLTIDQTRPRETPAPAVSFKKILDSGTNILWSGAQAASSLVGGPLLSVAVRSAKVGSDTNSDKKTDGNSGDSIGALEQKDLSEDYKLLALQNEIQKHDRQVALASNMMKARHDTAKTAIGNIRA